MGTEEGVIKARTFARKPTDEERWDVKWINNFKGVPWEPEPGSESVRIRANLDFPRTREGRPTEVEVGKEKEKIIRQPQIRTGDMAPEMGGPTMGCPACDKLD